MRLRIRVRRRMNASVPLKRPPTSRPNTTRRQRPRPPGWSSGYVRLLQSQARPHIRARSRLPVASDGADQGSINRDLRPLPLWQAVGHHLDPPAVRRRHIKVEVPQSDAGGHPRAGLTADASNSPLQWPSSMREHPNLCAGGTVVPELIEGSTAAASVWGERQRQSQPPKQEDAELPTKSWQLGITHAQWQVGSPLALRWEVQRYGQRGRPGSAARVREGPGRQARVSGRLGGQGQGQGRGEGPGMARGEQGRQATQYRFVVRRRVRRCCAPRHRAQQVVTPGRRAEQ